MSPQVFQYKRQTIANQTKPLCSQALFMLSTLLTVIPSEASCYMLYSLPRITCSHGLSSTDSNLYFEDQLKCCLPLAFSPLDTYTLLSAQFSFFLLMYILFLLYDFASIVMLDFYFFHSLFPIACEFLQGKYYTCYCCRPSI